MSGEAEVGLSVRRARERHGWSQEMLAHQAGISLRWLVEIEAGRADPRASAVIALARALEVEPAELLSQQGVNHVADGRKLAWEDDETKRREFLGCLVAMTSIRLVDWERLDALSAGHAAVDARFLGDMEAITRGLGGQWYYVAPACLLPAALGHLGGLKGMLPGPSVLGRRLASLTGSTALLVGHLQLKLEQRGEAYASFALAEALARDAGDDALRAHVLAIRSGMYSQVALGHRDDGDPALALAHLDQAVRAGAGGPARLLCHVYSRRAEERAAAGDEVGAMRDMQAAEDGLSGSGDGICFGPRNEAELGALRGTCEALLGRHRQAVATLDATLGGMEPSLVAWRAAVLADQGAALARLGQVDEACGRLVRALELARQAAAGDHLRRVRGVRRRDLTVWADAPAVRRLDERLQLRA